MPPRKRQPAVKNPTQPLPGGYKVGDKVFYTAASETLSNGDKVVHGQQGEVTGPATLGDYKGKAVDVLFPSNKLKASCCLTQVRRLRAASAATPRLRPARATLPTPRAPALDSLSRGAPTFSARTATRAVA